MKLFINDCSIQSQANDIKSAIPILQELVLTFIEAKNISSESKGYITRELKNRTIINNITLVEFVNRLNTKDPLQHKLKNLMIDVLLKRPFTENNHIEPGDTLTSKFQNCLKNTCFDDASGSKSGSLVISAVNSKGCFSEDNIEVFSSKFGSRKIQNVFSLDIIKQLKRTYEYNEKHQREARFIDGEVASPMDLKHDAAQIALTNGILIGKRVYSYYEGNWYQFHPHENNKFHGFKLNKITENNAAHISARKTLTSCKNYFQGQIYFEYVED